MSGREGTMVNETTHRPGLLIEQLDERPVKGARFVFAAKKRSRRAVCWASAVDGAVLRAVFEEVDALGLARPIVLYGHTCAVSETTSFRFHQVSGRIGGALALAVVKAEEGA